MLTVKSTSVELRGIRNDVSKNGKAYYTLNVETADGTPHSLYCPDFNAIPQGLKKGEMIRVTFNVHRYQNQERLVVCGVERG